MYRYNRVFEIGQTRQSYGAEFHKFTFPLSCLPNYPPSVSFYVVNQC